MVSTPMPAEKTIDSAIADCQKKIKDHKMQSYINLTLISILILGLGLLVYNYGKINHENQLLAAKNIYEISALKERLADYASIVERKINYDKFIDGPFAIENKSIDDVFNDAKFRELHRHFADSIAFISSHYYSKIDSISSIPNLINTSMIRLEKTDQYLLYGIFVLIFGVLVSFYRYHMKEVSKYEHFLFGLLRIRIAAANSDTGFEDLVRTSLTKDAFAIDQSLGILKKDKKIENPLPGHPSTELLTYLMEKILETKEKSK